MAFTDDFSVEKNLAVATAVATSKNCDSVLSTAAFISYVFSVKAGATSTLVHT